MRLPTTAFELPLETQMPVWLPEMTLPAPAPAPPMVFAFEAASIPIPTLFPGPAAVPAAFVPM